MSVDVEDWFQVENLRGAISRASWDTLPRRVVANTERILKVLDRTNTVGTFFCLGWIAEREPALIREIRDAGHEIASHGYSHRLIYEQDLEDFRADVVRAKELLQDITGDEVLGYRAPSFSITESSLRVLAETGPRYDSSWFPAGGHDRYGRVDLDRSGAADTPAVIALPTVGSPTADGMDDPWAVAGDTAGEDSATIGVTGTVPHRPFHELPITTMRIGSRPLPWGGGGWFRLYPARLFRRGFRRAVHRAGGGMFYLHPWEVDPEQPRVEGIKRSYAFRHYVNLDQTEARLEKLCTVVPFTRADVLLKLR
jgi:polysaccharide deacetylase family protein (PEP-CTERM system associated)